jgi:uncharacterized protein (DUF305 family)
MRGLRLNWMKTVLKPSLVLLVLMAAVLAGPARLARADAPAPERATAKYEVRFMENMIDHHAMAIMMAEMCLERAVHSELISMCQDIIASQSQEIAMMQTWLQDWYGIAYEPHMSPGQQKSMERQAMRLSPEEFEIWFMRNMIRHHEQAIREAQECLERAYHPALLSLCRNIIETQRAEIEQMQAWLCEWYGICRKQ